MTVTLFAFTCGELTSDLSGFLEGEPGKIKVPVPSYLIDHPQGKVVFDTGLNIGLRQDKRRFLGPLADNFDVDFPDGHDVASRLAAVGINPRDIRYIVNSHLHFDHCGGNALLPNATVIVQKPEWKAGHNPKAQASGAYSALDFDHGHKVMEIEGEHDIFGDGTLVLFPTYGHTPGHQSLRVQLATRTVILAADCCYLKRTLDALHLPNFGYNREWMREVLLDLRRRQSEGAQIFYGHDPDFWKTVPKGEPIV
jgi:glyoxylase-like metal-dependent hydrolase (beta-lactamase superfamily II)